MKHNKYSDLKIFNFPDKVKSFQEGRITAPLYVRIKPINTCNHGCRWCCVTGTKVLTSEGERPIETIQKGDKVTGPDGTDVVCVATLQRNTRGILQITANGRTIEVTAEHPFLTESGWIEAGNLRVGDRAFVQVRVRGAGGSISKVVARLQEESPATGRDGSERPSCRLATHEEKQSDENSGGSGAHVQENERPPGAVLALAPGITQQAQPGAYAIRQESYEESEYRSSGTSESTPQNGGIEIRGQVRGVAPAARTTDSTDVGRNNVHRTPKPGLSRNRTEKSNRAVASHVLQQREDIPNRGNLCYSDSRSLPETGVVLPCDISKATPTVLRGPLESHSRLCVDGVELGGGVELRRIDSIVTVDKPVTVYNLSCAPVEAFVAEGFIVHNCTYSDGTKRSKDKGAADHLQSAMHESMNEADVMPTPKLMELLDDLRDIGTKAVTFSGGGESLLHPAIVEAMEKCHANELDLSIITNGQLLVGPRARELAKAKWVRVSVDYTSAAQMVASRNVPERMYDGVIKNLRDFAAMKAPGCDLGINFIVTRENHEGLVPFAKLLKECGVENIRFSPVYLQGFVEYHEPIKARVEEQLWQAQFLCDDKFSINTTYDLTSPSKVPKRPFSKCLYAQTVPVVGADLGVYACHNTAYTEHGKIGSIKESRFRDMWFSPEAAEWHRTFDPSCVCNHECANQSKVVLFNSLADMSVDNFV